MKNRLSIRKLKNCEHIAGKGLVNLKPHTHKSFTVVYIEKGSLFISLNYAQKLVSSGTVIVLPPNNAISMSAKSEYEYHSLSVHELMCEKLCKYIGNVPFVFMDDGSIADFFRIYDSFTDDDSLTDFIIGIIGEKTAPSAACLQNVNLVRLAAGFIENHVKDELCVKDVADSLKVSTGYLSRIFKKIMHITPKQYLIQCRLREAKKELEKESSDVEIAYELGFASQSHMCTVFKGYMGISVGDYRDILKNR
ncbi:MAG: AraC family transcriptional regulator [Succinivibrio sp.]|uniref:AraC family transcriptional regulator n=1 Tax=Succinivibrio sp. TaxID=2053619 RepID=UPI002F94827C